MTTILTANDLRPGCLIHCEEAICQVMTSTVVRQERGIFTVKLMLKNIQNGSQKTLSVNPDLKFRIADIFESDFEYMYDDGDRIYAVSGEDFPISKVSGNILELISQGGLFRVVYLDEDIYKITLPKKAKVKIENTEPFLKGQTAKSSYKPATLCNGWIIQVPSFMSEEDEIVIDTTDPENPTYDSRLA